MEVCGWYQLQRDYRVLRAELLREAAGSWRWSDGAAKCVGRYEFFPADGCLRFVNSFSPAHVVEPRHHSHRSHTPSYRLPPRQLSPSDLSHIRLRLNGFLRATLHSCH